MKQNKVASLLLAGLLHITPVASRLAQTIPGLATSPIMIVMTWALRLAIVAGSYHTVSAASAILVSATTVNGTQGTPLSYQIRINDGENRTPQSWRINGVLFSASGSTTNGMPPGLRLSFSTGIINGSPTQGGNFPVTITAYENTGGGGAALTFTVTFKITPTAIPTAITTQPQSANLHVGEPLNLSVVASGTPPLSYKWQKDGTDIPGATLSTFSIATLDLTSAGSYVAIVTGGGGITNSNAAVLTVKPLSLAIQTRSSAATTLMMQTIPGRHYVVQATGSLNPIIWATAGEVNAGTGSSLFDDPAQETQRFWRYYPSP